MNEQPLVGIDIGGTQTRLGLFLGGELAARESFPTRDFPRLKRELRRFLSRVGGARLQAIGVGAPAPLDMHRGVIHGCPNLPHWDGVELVAELSQEHRCPVYLANDASCAALGELEFGHRARDFVYLTWSTGIGGGIVAGGRLVWGAEGGAGEVGHMVLWPEGPPCRCGKRGCLEAIASGTGISRAAREELGEELSAKEVVERARAGQPPAQRIVFRAAHALGQAISILAEVLEPELVVLGGGLTRAWDFLGPLVEEALERFSRRAPKLALTPLGDDVGLYGAAALPRHFPRRSATDLQL